MKMNKKMGIKFLVMAFLSTITTNILAQSGATDDNLQLNTITTAMPFLAITPDSRVGGMGDAGTALSANSSSIYWNTSMLIFAEKKGEIGLSYTPWLRQLTKDIHLSYLSGYSKIGKRHAVGGSLRFFSLGEITFTDNSGNVIRDDKPSEFEIAGAYAFRLSDRLAIGLNGKFAYSNLTGGLTVGGIDTKAGIAGAADLSLSYVNDDLKLGGYRSTYSFGLTINNIGNKVAYSNASSNVRDFLPMNLKIGNALKMNFDDYNALTFSIDIQKLLVPTPALYNSANGELISGKSSDVGIINGMVQSFYDAPGTPEKDANGNYVKQDGKYVIRKGSKFKEELSEINIGAGMEYWYNNLFALRAGYFFEAPNKGSRQFANFGFGLKYNMFGFDFSYLLAFKRQSPLANTLRFTLRITFGDKQTEKVDLKSDGAE